MQGLIGKKVGMTQIFSADGDLVPVTVLLTGPCTVVQKKTGQHAPSSWVVIGRTAVSDVLVNDYTVSKHHAEFVWDAGTRHHFLVDKGSTNGTSVGTRELSVDERCSLKSGYWLVFGRVVCQYLTAEAVYAELRSAG